MASNDAICVEILCRMMALIPLSDKRIDSSLVKSFRSLAFSGKVSPGSKPGHSDGWGIVSWVDGMPRYFGREPSNATTDPKYDEACEKIDSAKTTHPILVHLRKSSSGMKIRENTHPFVNESWAFAHNGSIRKLNLKVRTDSEWFFESLMRKFFTKYGGQDMENAISDQIKEVRSFYPYNSITFILSNGKEIYAYRDFTKNREYYGMHYTKTENSLVISQERFFKSDWVELENGTALHVACNDGTMEIERISETGESSPNTETILVNATYDV